MTSPDPNVQAGQAKMDAHSQQAVLRLQAAAAGVASPMSFSVEPDQLPVLKQGFQQAMDELRMAQQVSLDLVTVPPPGQDQVSVATTAKLASMANGDLGNLGWALTQARAVYQNLIDQCDTLMKNYHVTEHAAARPFKKA